MRDLDGHTLFSESDLVRFMSCVEPHKRRCVRRQIACTCLCVAAVARGEMRNGGAHAVGEYAVCIGSSQLGGDI